MLLGYTLDDSFSFHVYLKYNFCNIFYFISHFDTCMKKRKIQMNKQSGNDMFIVVVQQYHIKMGNI